MRSVATRFRQHSTHLGDAAFDVELERLLVEHDLEHGQGVDKPGNPASVDLRAVVGAAVDPLEIAAALEAVGMRPATVRSRFGCSDVFELADLIYRRVPLQPVAVARPELPSGGSWRDLLRGAIFIVPGIAFTWSLRAGGIHVGWWCLPFALTLGWALGQVVASTGYVLRNARDLQGGRTAIFWLLLASAVASAAGAAVLAVTVGGSASSVPVALLFVLFMVGTGVLLLHEEEGVLAVAVTPAALAAGAAFLDGPRHELGPASVAALAVAATLVVAGAVRHAGLPGRGRRPHLTGADVADAARHGFHGLCCGGLVSLVLALTLAGRRVPSSADLAAVPLLLTLGVMEWQLRSFRAGLARLKGTLVSIERYRARAWQGFVRSLGTYVAAMLVASGAVAAGLRLTGRPVPVEQLATQGSLGVALCIDLIVLASGGIRRTLRCWLLALAACAAYLVVHSALGRRFDATAALQLAVVAVGSIAVSLLVSARRVVRSPLT